MAMPLPLPTYTTDDLRAFPEDGQRYELLEGMLLVTPMPGSAHQVVLSRILVALAGYLSSVDRAVAVSPGEIEIAPKTLLEPDLLVFPASYPPGTPWSYAFNFGDGFSQTVTSPTCSVSHVYAAPGAYSISHLAEGSYTLGADSVVFADGSSLRFTAAASPAAVTVSPGASATSNMTVTAATCVPA